MKTILLFILLLPSLASAYNLNITQGITVYTINGNKVTSKYSNEFPLITGTNQISVKFDGKLRKQGKTNHFESKPYIITVEVQSDVNITTASPKYKKMVALAQLNKPIFKINTKIAEQKILPAISSILPYLNVPKLVTHYNEKNGIYFDKTGQKKLSQQALTRQHREQKSTKESKTLAQLKYWYAQANDSEKRAFEKWIEKPSN